MLFTKMQGLGNDYVYVNCTRENLMDPSSVAKKISDRHFGVGSDGLVLILSSDEADFEMRMFNSDGSESGICGNAVRCIGKYVYERGLTEKTTIQLKTGAGIRTLQLNVKDGIVNSVRVDMGEPILKASEVPCLFEHDICIGQMLRVEDNEYPVTCVSMGNPHCVIFTADAENADVCGIGPTIECHPAFPERTNVEFASVLNKHTIRMRVWERGTGETMACGSGACATLVAAVMNGLCNRDAIIKLNGGDLNISWDESTNHVFMEGGAEFVFDGEWKI